jgi:hypothetical protein
MKLVGNQDGACSLLLPNTCHICTISFLKFMPIKLLSFSSRQSRSSLFVCYNSIYFKPLLHQGNALFPRTISCIIWQEEVIYFTDLYITYVMFPYFCFCYLRWCFCVLMPKLVQGSKWIKIACRRRMGINSNV